MRALVLDARDSFVETLARYFRLEGVETEVVPADALTPADIRTRGPDLLVLSPGPLTPEEAGVFLPAVRECHEDTPIFGVCLGHLAIAKAFGGGWAECPPVHGAATPMVHDGHPVFAGAPPRFEAGRYHSLIAHAPEAGPLRAIAWTRDEARRVMAYAHETRPVVGVQFHPESALTPQGRTIIRGFLAHAFGPRERAA